jgi:hypothetical protein
MTPVVVVVVVVVVVAVAARAAMRAVWKLTKSRRLPSPA